MRIPRQVTRGQHDVLRRVANGTDESLPPIVEAIAEPRAAALHLKLFGAGIETKIVAAEVDRLASGLADRLDQPAVAGSGP